MLCAMNDQQVIAVACVLDAFSSAIDPSGRITSAAMRNLRDGLALSEEFGVKHREAAETVRQLLASLDDSEIRAENPIGERLA